MNNKYLDLLDATKTQKCDNFIARTTDSLTVKTDIVQVVRDVSWIDMIEEAIPYLDTIIRNPRKFIVQEEDIIPIEKTKKVTEESIKHLAQHTSLIQDVDENGMVMPLKLLNVFKEETIDLYENRFIYSLLVNLKVFLNDQLLMKEQTVKSKYLRNMTYEGKTKLANELVNIKVDLETSFLESKEEQVKNETIDERISNIVSIVDDFLSTVFIKSLNGATPVRSPIRKTNVILKDQNFIKALELWEFLEKYSIEESVKTVRNSKEEETGDLKAKNNLIYYLDYYALSNITSKSKVEENDKYSLPYLRKMIESFVGENNYSEREFRSLLIKEFKNAKKKKEKLYLDIKSIFKKNIDNHQSRIKKALTYLN